jgi:hypothetical protein
MIIPGLPIKYVVTSIAHMEDLFGPERVNLRAACREMLKEHGAVLVTITSGKYHVEMLANGRDVTWRSVCINRRTARASPNRSRVAELEAQNAELIGALRPFAEPALDYLLETEDDPRDENDDTPIESGLIFGDIGVGDLVKAGRVYEGALLGKKRH